MPRIISKSGRAQEEAMLVSTWKVVTVPRNRGYLPLALPAPTSTTSSQITNFRAPRAAQHGRFPSLLPAMPWRRLQLNRSATPTYVSTRGTREDRGQEGEFDVCQGGKEGRGGKMYLVSHRLPSRRGAAGTILCQKARSGQNLLLHMRIVSKNCRLPELPLYVHTSNADQPTT